MSPPSLYSRGAVVKLGSVLLPGLNRVLVAQSGKLGPISLKDIDHKNRMLRHTRSNTGPVQEWTLDIARFSGIMGILRPPVLHRQQVDPQQTIAFDEAIGLSSKEILTSLRRCICRGHRA
ncbi:hypothetical protein DL98DRAFT_541642 [Cadophora sp. DSE1049]|nr:hypothetical protein DL98DRAFT_541642 [Cadophora sp. DSE1049]